MRKIAGQNRLEFDPLLCPLIWRTKRWGRRRGRQGRLNIVKCPAESKIALSGDLQGEL